MTDTREVRERGNRVVHRTHDGQASTVHTLCGETLGVTRRLHTQVAYLRIWQGGAQTITECPTCFAAEAVTHEVRENASHVIHRSTTPPPGPWHGAHAVCGERLISTVTDARVWRGGGSVTLTECPDCFTTQPTAPPEPVIYQCIAGHGTNNRHHHSRTLGTVHPWDSPRNPAGYSPIMTGGLNSEPPHNIERHCAPDGTQYVFAREGYTTTTQPGNELVTPTTEETPTVIITTTTPGAIVRATSGRPFGCNPDTLFVVVCPTHGLDGWTNCIVGIRGSTGGWNPDGRHEVPDETLRRRLVDLDARLWSIRNENLVLADHALPTDLSNDMQRAREAVLGAVPAEGEEVDIYPLTPEKLRRYPSFTLYSREGQRTGNDLIFGCQRWSMQVVAENHGSMTFGEGNSVTASMPATRNGEYVHIGDRDRSIHDVNDWCTRIIATEAPLVQANAVVMEHGFYGCTEHEGEVLYLLNNEQGVPMLGRVVAGRAGSRGTVGLVEGFTGALRGHHPVSGSATAEIMNMGQRRWSLVPFSDRDRDFFEGSSFVKGNLDTNIIVNCDRDGVVRR